MNIKRVSYSMTLHRNDIDVSSRVYDYAPSVADTHANIMVAVIESVRNAASFEYARMAIFLFMYHDCEALQ